jgi:hypothetical protein
MAQFPVSDQQGLIDGLNYVLSGPSSLGQNFQGFSSSVTTALSGEAFNLSTGKIETVLPIESNTLQLYLTDCQSSVVVNGGTDRVVLSGQINTSIDYTTTTDASLQYTVFLNRYRAEPNTSTNYNDYLYYYNGTVASHEYNFNLTTTDGAIFDAGLSVAGTKPAYVAPTTGAIGPAVDTILTGLSATTGTGSGAVIRIEIAYGIAGTYNSTNTRLTVISPGGGWTVGSTIVIPGDQLGGATPANDMTITVTTVTTGSSANPVDYETIFTNIIDQPVLGYYLYVLELQWYSLSGGVQVDNCDMGVRSISAQVVKQ